MTLTSVIPIRVRPSALGWSNGVEEPDVCLLRQIAVLIFLAALFSSVAVAQELPEGWRRPTRSETSGAWRKESPTRFLVIKGDFDGDGKQDIAELLVNPSIKQFGVFVKLAGAGQWQPLITFDLDAIGRYAIDFVKPGKYKTACGKGYGDYACAHGEPDFLVLKHPAVDFIYTHSGDIIDYWDQKSKSFHEVQMSD
jgi:hypothetical protein